MTSPLLDQLRQAPDSAARAAWLIRLPLATILRDFRDIRAHLEAQKDSEAVAALEAEFAFLHSVRDLRGYQPETIRFDVHYFRAALAERARGKEAQHHA